MSLKDCGAIGDYRDSANYSFQFTHVNACQTNKEILFPLIQIRKLFAIILQFCSIIPRELQRRIIVSIDEYPAIAGPIWRWAMEIDYWQNNCQDEKDVHFFLV